MNIPARTTNRLLAVLLAIIVLWALKWAAAVTMPLAFTLLLLALSWPIRQLLRRILPSSLSFVGTVLALCIVLALFIGGIWFSIQSVAGTAPRYSDEFFRTYDALSSWLRSNGLQPPSGEDALARAGGVVQRIMSWLWALLGYCGLIAGLLILALPEVPRFRRKIRDCVGGNGEEVVDTLTEAAIKIQQVLATITFTSALTGILTGLYAWALGLDFAFAWGVLGFLLNYIPVIGSVIAVIPPALFAILQFDGYGMPLLVFFGLSAIQLGMGTFVYPWVQGRTISVSPAALLFSLTFWGFLWGITGAFLAVPMTIALIIFCQHFPSTRWLSVLLTDNGTAKSGNGRQRAA
ncbi:MAG TPA: AI-2E family transporter [Alphaproteobacteria bacterium]|nr:AI-2E family transporter [Alphaproteobacteria bacterium]